VALKWRGSAALSVVAVIRSGYDVGAMLTLHATPPAMHEMHALPLSWLLPGMPRSVGTYTCM
jgi:hypothetical protein